MVIILIPLFGYIYKNYFRMTLTSAFILIGVIGSIAPVLYFTAVKDPPVDAYAGFLNGSFNDMLTKIYYRLPPFLIGIAVAIFNFEYKHVNKLNDGSKPFHKDYIDKMSKNKYSFKAVTYTIGFLACSSMILLLWWNAQCLSSESQFTYILTTTEVEYCWGKVGTSLYYVLSPILFYGGLTLILTPSMIGMSTILRPLMNSHLWHIMEELTFNAFLL